MQIVKLPIPRRGVLKGAGALGAVLLAPKLPLWSLAEAAPRAAAPPQFLQLSSALLGISANSLDSATQAKQDDLSTSDVFYSLETLAGPSGVQALIEAWNNFPPGMPNVERAARMLQILETQRFRPDAVGTFARLTMFAWLFGVWYGGTETTRNPIAAQWITNPDYQQDFLISGRAYKNGWIWRIAQAHPMGFSQFSFGSWASPAPSLSNYGIPGDGAMPQAQSGSNRKGG
jgi:hypothetical protein